MFCPYRSTFENLAPTNISPASWISAARRCVHSAPRSKKAYASHDARGLAHAKSWRRIIRAALSGGAFLALLVCPAHAVELARTADYDYDPPTPGTYMLPVVKPAADGDVLDADGHSL